MDCSSYSLSGESVGLEDSAFHVQQQNANGRVLESAAEPLLAHSQLLFGGTGVPHVLGDAQNARFFTYFEQGCRHQGRDELAIDGLEHHFDVGEVPDLGQQLGGGFQRFVAVENVELGERIVHELVAFVSGRGNEGVVDVADRQVLLPNDGDAIWRAAEHLLKFVLAFLEGRFRHRAF